MKHTNKFRDIIMGAFAAAALVGGSAAGVAAQDASTNYRPAPGDPFGRSAPVVRKKKAPEVKRKPAPAVTLVQPPSIKARIDTFKEQRLRAMSEQTPAPKATTALLLGEVQITGIFRTPRGYAAMVEATPIKLSYVIYPGEKFYDGQLVAIEEGRLVFRSERVWSNGKRETNVEMKPLRKFAPADQLAAAAEKLKDTAAPKQKETPPDDKPVAEKAGPEKPEKPASDKGN